MARHGGMISSSGFYTTKEENEVIIFEYPVNAILIETTDEITLQLNNRKEVQDKNLWVISPATTMAIEDLSITSMTIIGGAGQTFKWHGLIE